MDKILTEIRTVYTKGNDKRLWWRGMPNGNWKIVPSIVHKNERNNECSLIARFMKFVNTKAISSEETNDRWDLLFLMQHHGCPTRILDWTESPLLALYFAVSFDRSQDNQDGVLYAIDPSSLNRIEHGQEAVFGHGTEEVKFIINGAWGVKHPNAQKVAAVSVQRKTTRQYVQLAEATIHGRDDALQSIMGNSLYQVTIPKDRKPILRDTLEMLQINRAQVFPDFDNISYYLVKKT